MRAGVARKFIFVRACAFVYLIAKKKWLQKLVISFYDF